MIKKYVYGLIPLLLIFALLLPGWIFTTFGHELILYGQLQAYEAGDRGLVLRALENIALPSQGEDDFYVSLTPYEDGFQLYRIYQEEDQPFTLLRVTTTDLGELFLPISFGLLPKNLNNYQDQIARITLRRIGKTLYLEEIK